jgi:hypothetical protein
MTITIKKLHLAIAVLVVALVVPATAFATHVFTDVDDARFYAEPVEWAAANGITTGTSPTTFDPDRPVTRGESVTFLKRYHDAFGMMQGDDDLTVHTVMYRIDPDDTGKFEGTCPSVGDIAVGGEIFFPDLGVNFENKPAETTAGLGSASSVGGPVLSVGGEDPRPGVIDVALVTLCASSVDFSTAVVVEP